MIRGDRSHYAPFGKIVGALLPLPPAPSAMTELKGGEPLEFDGIHFTAVATPGHTPGSMMYLHGPMLFTGDSLMRKGDGVTTVGWLFSEIRPAIWPRSGAARAPLRQHRGRTRGHRARRGSAARAVAGRALEERRGRRKRRKD
jgi:glyoxylase-like metal-dependent hydrolase (beta-lactamase superfamily II)